MNSRIRYHLSVIAAIFLTIYLLHMLNKSSVEQQPVVQAPVIGSRFIMVYEASWGLNCNLNIERTLIERKKIALKHPPGEAVVYHDGEADDLSPIQANNVLLKISELCNTKETCDFIANNELLGSPYNGCTKQLKLLYRCYEYDRLHSVETYENQDVSIKCKQKDTVSAATAS